MPVVLAVVAALGALATGCGKSHDEAKPAARPGPTASPPRPAATAGADDDLDPAHLPKGWSLVAWPLDHDVPIFAESAPDDEAGGEAGGGSGARATAAPSTSPPTGAAAQMATRTLTNPNAQGAPLALLVEHYDADWLRVSLPVRPNGTSGWIRRAGVQLGATPFSLAVDRASHVLTVFKDGKPVRAYPVGIGTGSTPTPAGRFYLAELLKPASPAGPWGPYAFGLSGFSDVVTTFNGADGIIGLHGTNQPERVGTDVSMGCIRLRNEDITELADLLPVGTPITIT
ncbi:L,D-transpeptidase [Pseudofrankia saprophytica]|uniref:L,D-transpeptidase n=1 Tax=Pseudofrankia saprophytica TaxID=298655 RepID=UPI00030F6A77|nr:L,D-transpeptidase [Pseudofrankia saprophytica]